MSREKKKGSLTDFPESRRWLTTIVDRLEQGRYAGDIAGQNYFLISGAPDILDPRWWKTEEDRAFAERMLERLSAFPAATVTMASEIGKPPFGTYLDAAKWARQWLDVSDDASYVFFNLLQGVMRAEGYDRDSATVRLYDVMVDSVAKHGANASRHLSSLTQNLRLGRELANVEGSGALLEKILSIEMPDAEECDQQFRDTFMPEGDPPFHDHPRRPLWREALKLPRAERAAYFARHSCASSLAGL